LLVRVLVAPMCAEFKRFLTGDADIPLGHEAVGQVVEAPTDPELLGQRVVAMPLRGCGACPLCLSGNYIYCQDMPLDIHGGPITPSFMSEYIVVPRWLAVPIPDDIGNVTASAIGCALGASYGGLRRLKLGQGETVLVTGLGPVGLGAVVNAKQQGARVIAIEPNRRRRELAVQLGADVALEPAELVALMESDSIAPVDAAIECSGTVAAQRSCIDVTRRLGRVGFVGESDRDLTIRVSRDMLRKGLTLLGSWHYNRADADGLLAQAGALQAKIDTLVTHRLPLASVQEAFEIQAAGDSGKVVLEVADA
jgi:L-iditol 2-dehydrogenase